MKALHFLLAFCLCIAGTSGSALAISRPQGSEKAGFENKPLIHAGFLRFGHHLTPHLGRSNGRSFLRRRGRLDRRAVGVNGVGAGRTGRPPRGGRVAGPSRPQGGRPDNLPPGIALGAYGAGSVLVLGYGGSRPPIAPPSALPALGEPNSIADALLRGKRYRPDEILIEVPDEGAGALRDGLARQYAVEVSDAGFVKLIGARLLRVKLRRGQNLREVLARLLQDQRIIRAQPNYIYTPVQGAPQAGRPAAARSGLQSHGKSVKVAVIDSCIDSHHPEIDGSVEASYDAVTPGAPSCSPEDHGTAVASLIAGHGQIHGPASEASLLAARAFTLPAGGREAEGTSAEIVLALDWAAESGAQVANMSFAGPSDPLMERSVAAAYRKGIVLVAAAGNAGPSSPPLYPAAYPETVAVTACDSRQRPYAAANRGSHIAITARGVDVLVAHAGNAYATESGTSFAAATVSGVIAVMREMRPKASPDEVKAALVSTAVAMKGSANDGTSGHGFLDAVAAVAFVQTNVSQ